MPPVTAELRLPSDDELAQLADLARVPRENRTYFFLSIRLILTGAGPCRRRPPTKSPSLSRVVKALHEARVALANLDESERQRWLPNPSNTFLGSDLEFHIWLLLISMDTESPLLNPYYPIQRRTKHRGRPPHVNKNPRLRQLIDELFWTAEIAQGYFTVEKHVGEGTILEALDAIAPYVAAEILPKKLPLSIQTIQRIKTDVSRRVQQYLPTDKDRRHWRLAMIRACELFPPKNVGISGRVLDN
jgi:hypothetical protein